MTHYCTWRAAIARGVRYSVLLLLACIEAFMSQQSMIKIQPLAMNFSCLYGQCHGAARFTGMAAITEFALPDIREKFDKTPCQIFIFNMI